MGITDTRFSFLSRHAELDGVPSAFRAVVEETEACLKSHVTYDGHVGLHRELRRLIAAAEAAMPAEAGQREECAGLWRSELHPFFLQAPLARRAYEKPLGYAGDYEVMNMVYRNAAEGTTAMGRTLHRFMNSWRAAVAVRNRRRWILQRIQEQLRDREGRVRIASIASGPAVEMQDLIRESFLADRANLLCLDQDPQSLQHAEQGIWAAMEETGAACLPTFSNDSVRLLIENQGAGYEAQDFIYTLGLYDYLPERAAVKLTRVLYSMLRPGGCLVIGNFAPHCDARFAIELICDWHLVYRSLDDMLRLAIDLPGATELRVEAEPTGTNLFLLIRRA